MEKLHFIWQLRMAAMRLHKCFLLMVLLLKPKQMYAFLLASCRFSLNLYFRIDIEKLLFDPPVFLLVLQNGMTPLHLAVWHSLRAEDCSTVKTLLEYNADCSAKDNVVIGATTLFS